MPWPLLLLAAIHSGLSPMAKGQRPALRTELHRGQAPAALCSPVSRQDPALKLCLVQSLHMATQAICNSPQAGSFHFSQKAELVAHLVVSSGWVPGQLRGCQHRQGRWAGAGRRGLQ